MLGVKKGQKLWLEDMSRGRRNRELTVAAVGRRWITFVEDSSTHADFRTDIAYERRTVDSYRRGKIWLSEAEFRSAKHLEDQWMNFCSTLGSLKYHPPRGMTLEHITKARKALGMELDPKKTALESFDEVK